ncbi:MAG TPA: hypothetical protein VIK59_01045 [Verrucomicrobiae bacterium]
MNQKSKRPATRSNAPADEPNILSSGMGAPPVSHGKKVENILPHDDLTTERSVEDGVEDAEEDSMKQAEKYGTRSEG